MITLYIYIIYIYIYPIISYNFLYIDSYIYNYHIANIKNELNELLIMKGLLLLLLLLMMMMMM